MPVNKKPHYTPVRNDYVHRISEIMLKHKCHSTDKAQFMITIGTEISVIRLAVISFITIFTK